MVELDALNIHQLWTPSPYCMHSKVYNIENKKYDLSLAGRRIIDIRPTKSLGLILGLMHQIKLKINIDV